MPVFGKEKHLSMRMEHISFGKEELERRRKSPIHVKAEEIEAQLNEHFHVYLVDPLPQEDYVPVVVKSLAFGA